MATFEKRGPYQIRAKVRRKGQKAITKTFSYQADAQRWARQIESEMDRGSFVSAEKAEKTTFREALERYRDKVFPQLASGGEFEQARLRRLIKELGDKTLAALESSDIAEYRDDRLKAGASNQTVKHDIGLISRVLKYCETDWGVNLPRGVVTDRVKKPALPNGRDRRLVGDEQERLLAAALASRSSEIGPIIEIAIQTAARRGEIQNMRWENVNLETRTWFIPAPDTKTKVARTVPLNIRATEVLRAIPRRPDGYVWSIRRRDGITQAFSRVCKRAGIENLRFHDLRHEATSRLFEKGLNQMEVATITGHQSLAMLKRYTHLKAEDLVARLG